MNISTGNIRNDLLGLPVRGFNDMVGTSAGGTYAPHAVTARGSYTVPAGYNLVIQSASLSMRRATAPTAPAEYGCRIVVTDSGATYASYPLYHQSVDTTVGVNATLTLALPIIVESGGTVYFDTWDLSTGGTCYFNMNAIGLLVEV